jgi:Transposase
MKRQTRPFTVEVKQRRGLQQRSRSIWGDVDLSALIAEAPEESSAVERPDSKLIDSDVLEINAEENHKPLVEHHMADPQETEPAQSATVAEAPETKKKAPRSRKAKAEPKPSSRKSGAKSTSQMDEAPTAAVRTGRKIYSEKERARTLSDIEQSIGRGDSIRSAVKQVGISEQTYYHWKKAAAPVSESNDLKDLLALEEENKRLKRLLAERLREENAELRKKLGLE